MNNLETNDSQFMNDSESNFQCQGCGETFTAFLRDMAAHNAEVVCPHCGKVHDHARSDADGKSSPTQC